MRWDKLEKMLSYDRMIKKQHKPNPSQKKHIELELLKKSIDPNFIKI